MTDIGVAGPAGVALVEKVVDRAARVAATRQLTRDAAARWLSEDTVAAVGDAVVEAIARYAAAHRQQPTWAEAFADVDPELLTTVTEVPAEWPLSPAVWRRDMRIRLMERLRSSGRVSYSSRPRSLHVRTRGRQITTGAADPRRD